MPETPIKIKFSNRFNPDSSFDIIKIEELTRRTSLDHNPYQLHKVEFYIVLFITEGKGKHTIDFTDYSYQQGTILTIRKDQIHKFHKNDDVKGFLLLFMDDFLVSYLEKLESQKSLQLFNELLGVPKVQLTEIDFRTIQNIISRIEDEYFRQMDNYSLGIIRSELHILITKLYRIKSQNKQVFSEKKYLPEFIDFQKYVEQNVFKTKRVSEYATMLAVSTKTLNTVSRSIINKSAKEFIDEVNIKQIKRLLINTPLSVKEIAFVSGFEETTNFYKYFKRQVGSTPEQFRSTF